MEVYYDQTIVCKNLYDAIINQAQKNLERHEKYGFGAMPWLTRADKESLKRGELSASEHVNLEKLARNQSNAKSFLFGDKKIGAAVG